MHGETELYGFWLLGDGNNIVHMGARRQVV